MGCRLTAITGGIARFRVVPDVCGKRIKVHPSEEPTKQLAGELALRTSSNAFSEASSAHRVVIAHQASEKVQDATQAASGHGLHYRQSIPRYLIASGPSMRFGWLVRVNLQQRLQSMQDGGDLSALEHGGQVARVEALYAHVHGQQLETGTPASALDAFGTAHQA